MYKILHISYKLISLSRNSYYLCRYLMKKISGAILLTLYLAFSSGVIINLHYCMDRFDSMKLGTSASDVCGKCGMHKSDANQCCNDEVKVFKIDDDQQVTGLNYKFPALDIVTNTYPDESTVNPAGNHYSSLTNNHSPPLSSQDTYLQNCVFRI